MFLRAAPLRHGPARLATFGLVLVAGVAAGLLLRPGGPGVGWPGRPAGAAWNDAAGTGGLGADRRGTANAGSRAASASTYPATVLRVIDGDTFEARVQIWPGIEITTRVRLRGIDAPEMHARCRDEWVKAVAARAALAELLAEGGVSLARVGPDKYGGRVVAVAATRRTADVSEALFAAGHARRYGGGRRAAWC